MVKILLGISILVTALTAGLGFVTKTKVDGLKQNLLASQQGEKDAKAEATKTRGELKTAKDELTVATKTVDEQKAQLGTLEAAVATAKSDAEKSKSELEASIKKVADLETRVAAASTNTPAPTNADSGPVVLLQGELANVKKELEEARQVQETLRNREKESAEKLAAAERQVQEYRRPIERAGLTGRIKSVTPGWNFVVIDVGDRRGATVNSPLLVYRDGAVVARLRITSVEPTESIADVVPGSMVRGQSIQPGDRVVFAGRQAAPTSPTPAAPGAPAPAPDAASTARAL
jgi:hypothetical protein